MMRLRAAREDSELGHGEAHTRAASEEDVIMQFLRPRIYRSTGAGERRPDPRTESLGRPTSERHEAFADAE